MSLKQKIIFLISAIFVIYGLAGLAIQHYVILPSFMDMERAEAIDNAERMFEALDRELTLLVPSATDWGTWDDTYNYLEDQNEAYVGSNLNAMALEGLKLNYLGLYDEAGHKVWGLAYDLDNAEPFDLGAFSQDTLPPGDPLLDSPGAENTIAGLYPTPQGAIMVVSCPILPNSMPGNSRGRILMGRLLDDQALNRLSEQAKVKIAYHVPEDNRQAGRETVINTGFLAHGRVELSETPEKRIGRSALYGLNGETVLYLEMFTPRTISEHGKRTLNFAILYLISSGVIVLLLLLLLLRRTLFRPLAQFLHHVSDVGTRGDLSARIAMSRKDEIGILADQFDRMVALLAEARQKLLEQSYQSGMAEIASGVLHNIGNAITPIGVKLSKVKEDLRNSPSADMEIAVAEVADPKTEAGRRADLLRFLQLAGPDQSAAIHRMTEEIKAIQAQLDFINTILSDQRRFSRAEKVLEMLQPARLIDDSIKLLPETLVKGLSVVLEPELTAVGQVRCSQVALQQIVGNLLINAAEAIQEKPARQDTGQIRITAAQESHDGRPFVHLSFKDNGVGIAPESLPRLFARGFTTKPRGSGMGLHWSANTVASMGGRIFAESPGPGLGSTFHLLLPQAPASGPSPIGAQEIAV